MSALIGEKVRSRPPSRGGGADPPAHIERSWFEQWGSPHGKIGWARIKADDDVSRRAGWWSTERFVAELPGGTVRLDDDDPADSA